MCGERSVCSTLAILGVVQAPVFVRQVDDGATLLVNHPSASAQHSNCWLRIQERDLHGQLFWKPLIVIIEECYEIPARFANTSVSQERPLSAFEC